MKELFKLLENHIAVQEFFSGRKNIVTDDNVGVALLTATNFKKNRGRYNIITSNLYNAQKMYDFLSTLVGEESCLFYPVDELLRTEVMASSKEMLAQRLFVMNELVTKEDYILITHAAGVMNYIPSKELFLKHTLQFEVGQIVNIEEVRRLLANSGYLRVPRIDQSLQFASRGDILDIYSVNNSNPIRIEFFDETIESIRYFDLATQESLGSLEKTIILPAMEKILSDEEKKNATTKILQRLEKDLEQTPVELKSCLKENTLAFIEKNKEKLYSADVGKFYAFLQESHSNILEYGASARTIIANEDAFLQSTNLLLKESTDFLLSLFEEGKIISHLSLYNEPKRAFKQLKSIIQIKELSSSSQDVIFPVRQVTGAATNLTEAKMICENYISTMSKTIIAIESKMQYEVIKNVLIESNIEFEERNDLGLPKGKVSLSKCFLDEGFELASENIVFLTSRELFNFKSKFSRYTNRYKEAVILQSEKDLEPGDYVVHDNHGIGRFLDIITLEVEGVHRDFLHIQYAGTDVLYIPLEQFKLVRKFIGKEGAAPKLNRLGSGEWEKTKKRIKERINEMADRLFKLYSERTEIKGFSFVQDDEIQLQFENEFPYDLTKDQQQSILEIKQDMEKPLPMDRLLCGDVGFGKTEIAFRAAFKAILSGKQVAILCPTTLLARQHYERALERFSNYGVKIAVFSRLVDESRQKNYIERIRSGEIDLVIGTHRILSKDIVFQGLGLLVVDEEQRFGVEQKEKIKELKTTVDVLTLTATPIPRTLQMSLVGLRQLSQLNTAPTNRMPIQTYVMPHDNAVVKELIERELARNGQVFYLHNNVSSIGEVANRLQKSIKKSMIGVVHGKMNKDDVEDVMLRFYNNEINVLVCTSIIETGIDIANANMIIIENADRFGLSQLYQIKGRVGRGDRIAYAYLLYKPDKEMTEIARKRLKAIQDFTELGSGYKIAQRDLLIRGAGDMLGPEQAGFIDTVGIDMYISMLNEAIQEKKTGEVTPPAVPARTLAIDAYIPENYVSEKGEKIEFYQQIESASSLEEHKALRKKMRDVYGRIPEEVERLFQKKDILFILENRKVFASFVETNESIDIILSQEFSNIDRIGILLFQALSNHLNMIKVSYVNKHIKLKVYKKSEWFGHLSTIINIVTTVYGDTLKNLNKM